MPTVEIDRDELRALVYAARVAQARLNQGEDKSRLRVALAPFGGTIQ